MDMTHDCDALPEPTGGAAEAPGSEALRARLARFARIRAAHRALPGAASEIEADEEREVIAASIRTSLRSLSERGPESRSTPMGAAASLEEVDASIDAMETELLSRVDRAGFSELRTSIPRAASLRRDEVLALVDSLLADRDGLLERLAKLEYLVTVLSTDEVDGERKIIRDPVTLTPALEALSTGSPESDEAETMAVELYQAASLDDDEGDLVWSLRQRRDRKSALGLTCLAPSVLRAVVTYNTRIFNRFESDLDSSREEDAILDRLLGEDSGATDDNQGSSERRDQLSESDEVWDRIGASEDEPSSVFDSEGLATLLEALRRRLAGTPIGSCTSERIALSLDVARLEELEKQAIRQLEPSSEERILACTAVVGLLNRDIGVVRSELAEVGIEEVRLRRDWVLELDSCFAPLIAERISDAEQYELAGKLSGIKTGHLLAPLSALRAKTATDATGRDESGVDRAEERAGRTKRAPVPANHWPASTTDSIREGAPHLWIVCRRLLATAALPCIVLLAVFGANALMSEPSNVGHLTTRELAEHSPFLASAYRSSEGRGPLVIGRVDADFVKLPPPRRIAVASQIAEGLAVDGVREAMLYGPQRKLQIHYVGGDLRLPRRSK